MRNGGYEGLFVGLRSEARALGWCGPFRALRGLLMPMDPLSSSLKESEAAAQLRWWELPGSSGAKFCLSQDFEATWRWRERQAGRSGLAPPYWAKAWPGGQTISRFIMDNPWIVEGRRVMDLGAGCGLCSVVAAKAGAAWVQAVDPDPLACEAVQLNAAQNNVNVSVLCADLLAQEAVEVDVILAGDLWYERFLAQRVSGWLERQALRGVCVLVGDIGRAFLPRGCLTPLATYAVEVDDEQERADQSLGTVYSFARSPGAWEGPQAVRHS